MILGRVVEEAISAAIAIALESQDDRGSYFKFNLDAKEGKLFIRPNYKCSTDASVRHHDSPRFRRQEVEHTGHQQLNGLLHVWLVQHVIGDAQSKEDAAILIARCISDPIVLPANVDAVRGFFLCNAGGLRRAHRDDAARQKIGAGHIHQRLQPGECFSCISQRARIAGYFVAKGFRGQ